METILLLIRVWPLVLFLGGTIAMLAVALYRLKILETKYTEVKRLLFQDGGELRYTTVNALSLHQASCQAQWSSTVASFSKRLDRMEEKWEKVLTKLV